MPDGLTHFRLLKTGLILLPPLMVVTTISTTSLNLLSVCIGPGRLAGSILVTLGVPGGYLYGMFIDPDMDIVGMTRAEGRLMNKLGIVGGLLVAYWIFYGYLFRRHHRSVWTHGPVISTAIRYLYQFWLLFIWIYFSPINLPWVTLPLIGMFIGTVLADTIHYAADKVSGEFTRR